MAAGSGVFFARKEALSRLESALEKFPPLLERPFISCESEEKVSGGKTSEFRVMQWNVLADGNSITLFSKFRSRFADQNFKSYDFKLSLDGELCFPDCLSEGPERSGLLDREYFTTYCIWHNFVALTFVIPGHAELALE